MYPFMAVRVKNKVFIAQNQVKDKKQKYCAVPNNLSYSQYLAGLGKRQQVFPKSVKGTFL